MRADTLKMGTIGRCRLAGRNVGIPQERFRVKRGDHNRLKSCNSLDKMAVPICLKTFFGCFLKKYFPSAKMTSGTSS